MGGGQEQGKDIVMWQSDIVRPRRNIAVVVKAKPITGQASGKASAAETRFQIEQCFGVDYLSATEPAKNRVHECFVVCPHEIKKEALESLRSTLTACGLDRNVTYIHGEVLWEKVEQYLSERTLPPKLTALSTQVEALDPDIGIRVVLGDGPVRLQVFPKPTAPLSKVFLKGEPKFADTPGGRAAQMSFERHLRKGDGCVIEGAHIVEWPFPEVFEKLGLSLAPSATITMEPRRFPKPLTWDLELSAPDRPPFCLNRVQFEGAVGIDEARLESVAPSSAWAFSLTFNRPESRFGFTITFPCDGRNVVQQLEAIRLRQFLSRGCIVRWRESESGHLICENDLAPGSIEADEPYVIELLERIVRIQTRTGVRLSLPTGPWAKKQVDEALYASEVIDTGRIEGNFAGVSLVIDRDAGTHIIEEMATAGPQQTLWVTALHEVDVFGTPVNLGYMVRAITGSLATQPVSSDPSLKQLEVVFSDPTFMSAKYPDWLSAAEAGQLRQQFPALMEGKSKVHVRTPPKS